MRILMLIAIAAALTACATATPMHGPDGKEMLAIECHGSAQSPAACYKKAGEICGTNGYDILGKDGEAIPIGTSTGYSTAYQGLQIQQVGMVVYRTLYVRCKPAS